MSKSKDDIVYLYLISISETILMVRLHFKQYID